MNRLHGQLRLVLAAIALMTSGLGASSVYGQAQGSTTNFTTDFEIESSPLCGSGDFIRVKGTTHFLFHEKVTPSGTVHQSSHMNFMKSDGIGIDINGIPTGDRYQINEVQSFTTNDNTNPMVVHSVIHGKLIHNGKPTDTSTHINLLTVFDEDGNPKTVVEHISFECKGPRV